MAAGQEVHAIYQRELAEAQARAGGATRPPNESQRSRCYREIFYSLGGGEGVRGARKPLKYVKY